ncbi:hypothetical protein ABGV42_00400 [Paenibacillus pabuli]|uniref:hypothetical protein n=1 Tax=Paenibacillus pabuli TaxID=1472 RepID=UPI003242D344
MSNSAGFRKANELSYVEILNLEAGIFTDYMVALAILPQIMYDNIANEDFILMYNSGTYRYSENIRQSSHLLKELFEVRDGARREFMRVVQRYLNLDNSISDSDLNSTIKQLTALDHCKLLLMWYRGIYK